MSPRKKPAVTEAEWRRVFELRCRSKRGERLAHEDIALCTAAYKADGERYAAMNDRVFEATKPFGSGARLQQIKKEHGSW